MTRTKPTKPKIYPRSSWHARPGGGLVYPNPLSDTYYRVTCHHDADPAHPNMTLDEALTVVRRHQATHFGLGWSDIGYHYLIAPGGQIIEGRPLNTQGAHVADENYGNVGICVMGALHISPPTRRQLDSIKLLYAWLCWDLDLDSSCLRGHLDYLPTQCPGKLYGEIPEIRTYAKKALTGQVEPPPAEPEQPKPPSLVLDGKYLGSVLIVDGESFAPVRVLADALNLKTGWDGASKTVSLTRGS